MSEERFRFIDLAVRPLADGSGPGELARGEAMDRLAHARPAAGDDTLEKATARLEEVPPRPYLRAGLTIGCLVLLLALLLPVVKSTWAEWYRIYPPKRAYLPTLFGIYGGEDDFDTRVTRGMKGPDRLFLLVNTTGTSDWDVDQWRQGVRKPGPGEFVEEAINSQLTPGESEVLLEKAYKADSENGFWPLALAQNRAAYGGAYYSPGDGGLREIRNWLAEARTKPRTESGLIERTRRRLEMLGPAETLAQQSEQLRFLKRQRPGISPNQIRWGDWGGELVTRGTDPWREWTEDWRRYVLSMPSTWDTDRQGQEIFQIQEAAREFHRHATMMKLPANAARMKRIEGVAATYFPGASGSGIARTGPRLARFAGVAVRERVDAWPTGLVSVEDLAAGRMAEHAAMDRFAAVAAALVFGWLGFLAMLEGWRRLPAQRGLAAGVLPLFRKADYAWIAGLGVLLPLVWHIGVVRFTPLSCRDLALQEWDRMPALQQTAGSVIFAWCLLLQSVRWRIAKRAGFLGMRPPLLWVGWVMAAIAGVFVPAIGLVRYLPARQEEFMVLGSSVAGLPLLWLLWRSGLAAFQPREASLGGILACRLLLPLLTAASALCLLLTMPLLAEEKRWVAQDRLGGIDAGGAPMQAIDARALDQVREDLRKVWGE